MSIPLDHLAPQAWAHKNNLTYVLKKETQASAARVTSDPTFLVTTHLTSGSFKKISLMVDERRKDSIRAVVPGSKCSSKKRKKMIANARQEVKFLEDLHTQLASEEKKYFVPPHVRCIHTQISDNSPKLTVLQDKYVGDGRLLIHGKFYAIGQFLYDSATALTILHRRGFVEGDFKPANVLILRDQNSSHLRQAKLSEFGGTLKIAEKIGTRPQFYTPPEVFLNDYRVKPSRDAYALGVSILTLLFDKTLEEKLIKKNAQVKKSTLCELKKSSQKERS